MMPPRVRFAPSPTGWLHIGGLRTALYNYFFARKNGGQFILRIEDTDRQRFVEGGIGALIKILERLGLDYDEGPRLVNEELQQDGKFGPYVQSARLAIYRQHAEQLLAAGHAYRCFCSPDELVARRQEQTEEKMTPKYDRRCWRLSAEEIQARLKEGNPHVIRLFVPEGQTTFEDLIHGPISVVNSQIDDQVLLKSDGFPTYHLAVVIDDHLMEVSHVIRGEEWISSTPKHVILYQFFGWPVPIFAHLPLLLNSDRSKLSKRQGDVSVEDFLRQGYLPEALINFVALMGFNPKGDQEIYSISELIGNFNLEKVHAAPAVVNREKLDWLNGSYLRSLTGEELAERFRKFLEEIGEVSLADAADLDLLLITRALEIEKSRLTTLRDFLRIIPWYHENIDYDSSLLIWKKADDKDARERLLELSAFLQKIPSDRWTILDLEIAIKKHIEEKGLANGNVLWPLRVALSGRQESPSPFELAWALGKERTLSRINQAVSHLN